MKTTANLDDGIKLRLFSANLVWDESTQTLRVADSNVPGLVGRFAAAENITQFLTNRILGFVALSAVINAPRENEQLYDRIERRASILAGKPVIKGTCIPVEVIIQGKIEGAGTERLLEAYPQLTRDDIRAALLFANDAISAYRSKRS